jgi:prepilin-type N-terminal cleavage/methylation domain-containing protein
MKKILSLLTSPRKFGFTLVELLVVVGIIAILAGVTLSVAVQVINIAKRTKAQNTAQQIQAAGLQYYTEYSVYPTPSGVSTDFGLTDADKVIGGMTAANEWGNLIECLSGNISPSTSGTLTPTAPFNGNTRNIAFLTMKATDVDPGSPNSTNKIADKDAPLNPLPFNSAANPYFNIVFDGDYDNILGTGASAVTTMPNFTTFSATGGGTSTAGIAVWANCSPNGSTTTPNWYVHTY